MKALTIHQPYASMIADGEKWVENRTWYTNYRGPLAIHAGKGTRYLNARELVAYPSGCVVAVAKLVMCEKLYHLRRDHQDAKIRNCDLTIADVVNHEHTEGPWCWILKDVRKLAVPVPVVGKQGLWEWDEERSPM